jgi:hypothetical protein
MEGLAYYPKVEVRSALAKVEKLKLLAAELVERAEDKAKAEIQTVGWIFKNEISLYDIMRSELGDSNPCFYSRILFENGLITQDEFTIIDFAISDWFRSNSFDLKRVFADGRDCYLPPSLSSFITSVEKLCD